MDDRSIPHAYPMSVEYENDTPTSLHDQNFGEGLASEDLLVPTLYHGYYIRPRINKQLGRGFSQIATKHHKFQVFLDVCQFLPDELSVRTVDNLLEVSGSHPQKLDSHGFISREFKRTYILPLDVDPLLVQTTLTHDGILCIEAQRKGDEIHPKVNNVKINLESPARIGEARAEKQKEKLSVPATSAH